MARGKHARSAALKREAALLAQIAELEAKAKAESQKHHDEVTALRNEVAHARQEIAARVAEKVHSMLIEKVEHLHEGLSNAVWQAQRRAMTQHLAWLFFKGYLSWDRFEGDREVLTFIATHGRLEDWWGLTRKYGHRQNRSALREEARRGSDGAIATLLVTLKDIDEAQAGDERLRASREHLDELVAQAQDAFVGVELVDVMDDPSVQAHGLSEEDVASHAEVMASLDEFRQRAPGRRVSA